ncbi:hypothetical protein QE152_g11416 [Popillia japonica]|uniref:Uncharacterized protein n=1 Tax=Popillia japonica TaxID=7064 RepID=A0AAW1LRI6_POPJA
MGAYNLSNSVLVFLMIVLLTTMYVYEFSNTIDPDEIAGVRFNEEDAGNPGRQNKRAFYKLRIYKILTDAVRVRVKSATDAVIDKHVGRWLAVAGDREGDRKKRNVLSENYVH